MNRKNKIIVSVVGIFIVLLALVGITYGYYLTRIQGNTNTSSLSVNTANMELLYDDSTPIINATNLMPIYEDEVTTKAMKKTFTIDTLESTVSQYVTIKLTDIIIDEKLSNSDFKWALYENGEWITKYNFDSITTGQDVELISNLKLDVDTTKVYDLYIYIEETGQDQSDMMGKTFSAKIEIEGYSEPKDYEYTNLLLENLIEGEVASNTSGKILSSTDVHKSFSRSNYIEVDNSKELFFFAMTNYTAPAVIAFYDENKTFISGAGETATGVSNTEDLKVYEVNGEKIHGKLIKIPENAKYYIINVRTQLNNQSVYKYYYIDKKMIKEYNLPLDYESITTLTNLNIVNFGDSIFANGSSPNDISSYLNKYYGATTYNVAIGGTRMSNHSIEFYNTFSMHNLTNSISSNDYTLQTNSINSDISGYANNLVVERFNTLKSIDFNTIDYITIGFGTNDFTSSTLIKNDDNLDTSTYMGAARYSVNKIREIYPNIKIILLTPIYRLWTDGTDSNTKINNINKYLKDYGNALKELKNEYSSNVYVYDGYNDLGIDITTKTIYFDKIDGTHPNINGRKRYAYKLGKYIETLENGN